jgi:hypothetical protein
MKPEEAICSFESHLKVYDSDQLSGHYPLSNVYSEMVFQRLDSQFVGKTPILLGPIDIDRDHQTV